MFKRTSEISLDRLAKLILVSLYYRSRNRRCLSSSRNIVAHVSTIAVIVTMHPPVHPGFEMSMCPIPSAIRVTATFIRGTTDENVG